MSTPAGRSVVQALSDAALSKYGQILQTEANRAAAAHDQDQLDVVMMRRCLVLAEQALRGQQLQLPI